MQKTLLSLGIVPWSQAVFARIISIVSVRLYVESLTECKPDKGRQNQQRYDA
jgi:hypothetical protein